MLVKIIIYRLKPGSASNPPDFFVEPPAFDFSVVETVFLGFISVNILKYLQVQIFVSFSHILQNISVDNLISYFFRKKIIQ